CFNLRQAKPSSASSCIWANFFKSLFLIGRQGSSFHAQITSVQIRLFLWNKVLCRNLGASLRPDEYLNIRIDQYSFHEEVPKCPRRIKTLLKLPKPLKRFNLLVRRGVSFIRCAPETPSLASPTASAFPSNAYAA